MFLSTITDPRAGRDKLDKLSRTIQQDDRSYPGFNLVASAQDTERYQAKDDLFRIGVSYRFSAR